MTTIGDSTLLDEADASTVQDVAAPQADVGSATVDVNAAARQGLRIYKEVSGSTQS